MGQHPARRIQDGLPARAERASTPTFSTLPAALPPELLERYPEVSSCGNAVADYLGQNLMKTLDGEERAYLILHVNRVFERETAKRP